MTQTCSYDEASVVLTNQTLSARASATAAPPSHLGQPVGRSSTRPFPVAGPPGNEGNKTSRIEEKAPSLKVAQLTAGATDKVEDVDMIGEGRAAGHESPPCDMDADFEAPSLKVATPSVPGALQGHDGSLTKEGAGTETRPTTGTPSRTADVLAAQPSSFQEGSNWATDGPEGNRP